MLETIRKFGSTIKVFSTKDLKGDIQLRLGSSGSIKNMNTLVYDDIDKTRYKEVCRINGSIYSVSGGIYQANGWEVSDMYKSGQGKDSWYDFIALKKGGFCVGNISKSTVNMDDILWAYSPDAVVINNDQDVCQCASHRTAIFKEKHPRTFWGIDKDDNYIFCTAAGRLSNEAGLTGDEVREVLKMYNCQWGFMNDGGKCSQMMINSKLVNKTVTGGWYPVRNAIFVYESIAAEEDEPVVSNPTVNQNDDLADQITKLTAENERLKNIIANVKKLVA